MSSSVRVSAIAALSVVFIGLLSLVQARAIYLVDGQMRDSPTVQLWYEGLWKQLDLVSGTVTHHPSDSTTGNILIVKAPAFPYDPLLRELVLKRPMAIIMVQNKRGAPGDGMFYVDGKDRSMIDIPIAESYSNDTQDLTTLPEGTSISVQFENNRWKDVKLGTKFQAVCGAFLSLWETLILLLGVWRLYQFWREPSTSWLSIGPICLTLELIAVALRLSLTLVDPFWTYRMIPAGASNALFTVHFPFALSSGILLTFYWRFPQPIISHLTRPPLTGTFITHFQPGESIDTCSRLTSAL